MRTTSIIMRPINKIHLFIRDKEIKEYKEMVMECYQLLNVYNSLDMLKSDLAQLDQ